MGFFRLAFSGLVGTEVGFSGAVVVLPGLTDLLSFVLSVAALESKPNVWKSWLKSKSKSIERTSNAGRLGRLLRLRALWFCWLADKEELMLTVEG